MLASLTAPAVKGEVMAFESGTMVEFVGPATSLMAAQPGARAVVVGFRDSYVLVEWDRSDPRWYRQMDGGYPPHMFRAVPAPDNCPRVSSAEPRNNDGRESCFWCSVPTAKRGGGAYDVCPKCGR